MLLLALEYRSHCNMNSGEPSLQILKVTTLDQLLVNGIFVAAASAPANLIACINNAHVIHDSWINAYSAAAFGSDACLIFKAHQLSSSMSCAWT